MRELHSNRDFIRCQWGWTGPIRVKIAEKRRELQTGPDETRKVALFTLLLAGSCTPSSRGHRCLSGMNLGTDRKPHTKIVEIIGSPLCVFFMSFKHLFKLHLKLDNVFHHTHQKQPPRLWHVTHDSEDLRIQRFECFSLPCLLSLFINVFLVKVSMNESLKLNFYCCSGCILKWTCLPFPDQRLCFVCVIMWVYSGTAEVILSVLEVLQPTDFFLLLPFFLQRGKYRAKKLFSYCAETDWKKFRYTANFLPDVFVFIHVSTIYNISGIMFFQPLFKKVITPDSLPGLVSVLHHNWTKTFFLMTLPQWKNSSSMFPTLYVFCFECAWWEYSIYEYCLFVFFQSMNTIFVFYEFTNSHQFHTPVFYMPAKRPSVPSFYYTTLNHVEDDAIENNAHRSVYSYHASIYLASWLLNKHYRFTNLATRTT